jgi:hypothetical protein
MIKKFFLGMLLVGSFHTLALAKSEPDPGGGMLGKEPMLWNVDLFDELEHALNNPGIKNKNVYYAKVSIQDFSADSHFQFPKQPPADSKKQPTFELKRGEKDLSGITPKGQVARPGDIIVLTYFQKLEVYIPDLEKKVTIVAVKGGHLSVHPMDIVDEVEKTTLKKLANTGGEIQFPEPKKSTWKDGLKRMLKDGDKGNQGDGDGAN